MTDTGMVVRPMTEADLPICLAFTQAVKWPHRMIDWQLHFESGNGSVVIDSNGQLCGCILWWDYGAQYATVGLVVVPASMQGKGLGRTLMDTVMAQTGQRNLQLVATLAGRRLYEQCGFVACGTITQVQGELGEVPVMSAPANGSLRVLSEASLDAVCQLDAQAYQCDRSALLRAVFTRGRGVGLYAAEELVAFAMVRESGRGKTVGPVVACDDDAALTVITALLASLSGFVRFDLTDAAASLKDALETMGLSVVDEGSLMIKGEFLPAKSATTKTYALISQAFG